MEKFTRTLHGYNPDEVNRFLDNVISEVEQIISSNKEKNKEIKELKEALKNNNPDPELIKKAKKFDELSDTLNRAITIAQDTGEHIRKVAKKERILILEEAKKDANNILNDALKKSEKINYQSEMLKKNILFFKSKLKYNLEQQLKLVEEIEVLE